MSLFGTENLDDLAYEEEENLLAQGFNTGLEHAIAEASD